MRQRMDSLIQSLVLIRFGQELGTASETALAVAGAIDLLVQIAGRFFVS